MPAVAGRVHDGACGALANDRDCGCAGVRAEVLAVACGEGVGCVVGRLHAVLAWRGSSAPGPHSADASWGTCNGRRSGVRPPAVVGALRGGGQGELPCRRTMCDRVELLACSPYLVDKRLAKARASIETCFEPRSAVYRYSP